MQKHHILALTMALLGCCTAAQAATPPALYNPAQAASGAQLYSQHCAMCHGQPAQGWLFSSPKVTHRRLGDIFSIMTTRMPFNTPGSLTHAQYEDIMAYILKQNGYPAGTTALNYNHTLKSQRRIGSDYK